MRTNYVCSVPVNLPPEWLLRIDTHLHCSTLVSLLLEPNTVLGPMYLVKIEKKNSSQQSHLTFFTLFLRKNQLHSTLPFHVQVFLQYKAETKMCL